MNMVTLNGVQSTDCKGLLIQSLPPISKPLIRTQVEEIDGRDGDIVTKLGYAAYDKEMTIGLYGDYNVDDVISFFDSEGTVIFSNEPDKYYNYEIIEQIDFERLVRFRTATVTFHVQPFKYSAVDQTYILNNQLFDTGAYSTTKNGLTITADENAVTISGTSAIGTEVYIPINDATLAAGDYTLTASVTGTMISGTAIRVISTIPTDSDSFAASEITLDADSTVTATDTLTAAKTFSYLWMYIAPGTVNFKLQINLKNDQFSSLSVFNGGNVYSKPKVTIWGVGTINFSLNGVQIFVIDLADFGWITIDAAAMNAYQGDILLNRYVTGDYENLVLPIGTNTITWTGDVSKIELDDYTRWI